MNGNGYDNFNNGNSFNGMNNYGNNFNPQNNNVNPQFNDNMMNNTSNMGGGSKFFNTNMGVGSEPDVMVGPNPFDMIRSYEEAGNQENMMNNAGMSQINPIMNQTSAVPNQFNNQVIGNVQQMPSQTGFQPNVNSQNMGVFGQDLQNSIPNQVVGNMQTPFNTVQQNLQGNMQQPFMQNVLPIENNLEQSNFTGQPINYPSSPINTTGGTLQNANPQENSIAGMDNVNNFQTPVNPILQENNNLQSTQLNSSVAVVQNNNALDNNSQIPNEMAIQDMNISSLPQEAGVQNTNQNGSTNLEVPINEPIQNVTPDDPQIKIEDVDNSGQSIVNSSVDKMSLPEEESHNEMPTETFDQTETFENENTEVQEFVDDTKEEVVGDSLTQVEEEAVETPKETIVEEEQKPILEDITPEADLSASFNTDEFEARFGVNYDDAISKNDAIYKGLKYRITVLSEILIRLEYSDSGTFEDRPTELARFRAFDVPKVIVTDEEKMLTLKTSYFELTYEKEKPFTGTKFSPDQYLKIKLLDTDKSWFFGHAEARNFKSISSDLDDKSSLPKMEKGLYSTDGFVSIDDSKSLIFNQDGSVGKRNDSRIDTYLFLYKKDFGFCLKDFYRLTGYPPLIPRYAFGVWWNKEEVYDVNGIYSLIAKFRKYEIPISVLLLNNWSKNDVSFDREKIPSPENVINNLHSDGIRLGVDLKLSSVPSTQNGTTVDTPFNVYERGFMANYFNTFIKSLNQIGVDFYSLSYKGDMNVLRMINYYFYKYLNSEPNKRGMILSRNGLINSHLYPVNNSGEIIVDWKTLKMLPEFNSTSSNLGVSWWSHAIGGFKDGIEENELYTRFVQLGTYSPIFRFSSKGGHYYKREPWMWDVKTRKIVKDYTNLRHKMIPYLYSESYKYSKTGLPIIQPLYYRYPELYDEPTYRNEYYFGTELFIAPITDRKDTVMNRTVTKLFLPNGMWYDFKTGKKFPGGKRYISFFQDEDYPVFAKQGAIIPQAIISDENRNFTGNPEEMEIHIFPGKNNSYKLYEDDGSSNAYKSGEFMTTLIDYNYLPNNYTVIIRPLEGKEGIIPAKRRYKIRFRNTRFADDVIAYLGSERIQVRMVLDDQDFIVTTDPISTKEQLSINCKGKNIEIDAVRIINDDIDTIISDLKIPTKLKEEVSRIMFSDDEIKKKRIEIRKLGSHGLNDIFVKMFLKLLEYIGEF